MWKNFSARKLMSEVSEACPIRILLIEDQTLLRELLARTLAAEPDFKVAGQCASVREAFEIVSKNAVNMVLLDINSRAEQGGAFLNGARGVGYRKKPDPNPTADPGGDATYRLHTPHELADLRLFERAMAEFNAGRFADAKEL